jgi:hypothetical protein
MRTNNTKRQYTEQKPITQEDGKTINKVKQFFKTYGPTGVAVHFSVYFLTLGALYIAIDRRYIRVGDVTQWMKKIGLDKWFDMQKLEGKSKATNFATAWILAKPTEPIRFMLTLAITPYVVRLLRYTK